MNFYDNADIFREAASRPAYQKAPKNMPDPDPSEISPGDTESAEEFWQMHKNKHTEDHPAKGNQYGSEKVRRAPEPRPGVGISESHFEKGDKVKCLKSGMTGTVTKVDPEEKGKYYTVKRNDGKVMKYAPDELKALNENVNEAFTDAQIKMLKKEYGKIKQLNPDSPNYKKLSAAVDKMNPAMLKKLADADVKFLSDMARKKLTQKESVSGIYEAKVNYARVTKGANKAMLKKAMEIGIADFNKGIYEVPLSKELKKMTSGQDMKDQAAYFAAWQKGQMQQRLKEENKTFMDVANSVREIMETRRYVSDPADDNMIMQLRKAQDLLDDKPDSATYELTFRGGKKGKMDKKSIDRLLAAHDRIPKAENKRRFRIMIMQSPEAMKKIANDPALNEQAKWRKGAPIARHRLNVTPGGYEMRNDDEKNTYQQDSDEWGGRKSAVQRKGRAKDDPLANRDKIGLTQKGEKLKNPKEKTRRLKDAIRAAKASR